MEEVNMKKVLSLLATLAAIAMEPRRETRFLFFNEGPSADDDRIAGLRQELLDIHEAAGAIQAAS